MMFSQLGCIPLQGFNKLNLRLLKDFFKTIMNATDAAKK